MSVLIETTLGELVIDVFTADAPLAATNFLKLCKLKYFHGALFFNVQENFMVQTGDPTGTGTGGTSLYGQLYGAQANFFADEIRPHLKHNKKGLVGMANSGPNTNASQFYITTRSDDLKYLDGKHTLFGEVAEGLDVLDKINALYVDKDDRPFQDVRILHTHVLDDPFPDPPLLVVPPTSPTRERPEAEAVEPRLAADVALDDDGTAGMDEAAIEHARRAKEAKSRAVVLEMIGDLPDADVKPPDDVLFVCKLNPVTESSDLDMAFCRFGPCKSDVIRDYKTGDSLCFAFVEFTNARHCEEAYAKMNNVLLDDRRIKVDFSQSVSKLWNRVARNEKLGKHDAQDASGTTTKTRDRLFGKSGGRGSSGGRSGGRDGGRGGRHAPLQLKASKRGDEFDLVDEHDERDRRVKDSNGNSHTRGTHDRRRERSSEPASRTHDKRSREARRSRSRDRDRNDDRSRDRVRHDRVRSTSAERRKRTRRSHSRERRHHHSRSHDRRDAKRSRSRSRERESRGSRRR